MDKNYLTKQLKKIKGNKNMNPAYNQNYPKKVEIDVYSSMNT